MAIHNIDIDFEQLLKRYSRSELLNLYTSLGEHLHGYGSGLAPVPEVESAPRPSSRLSTATTIAENDNVLPYASKLRPLPASHHMQGRPGRRSLGATAAHPRASSPATIASKDDHLQCPLCSEVGANTTFRRRADLKKHMRSYHNTDTLWTCPKRGCGKAYDCAPGMKQHLKELSHGNLHHFSDCVMTTLCPRVVFACGFTNCKQIFEASDATDAAKTANKYFDHVVGHVEDDLPNQTWSHSTCFRNLMRQPGVDTAWKNRRIRGTGVEWQPHTSTVLRKMLETRHVDDKELLVTWAVRLGSKPYSEPASPTPRGLPAALFIPVFEECACGADSAPQSPYQPNPSPGSPQVPDSLPDRSADPAFSPYFNTSIHRQNVDGDGYTQDFTLFGVSTSFGNTPQGGYPMGVPTLTLNQQPTLEWSNGYSNNGNEQVMQSIDPALLDFRGQSWMDLEMRDADGQ